MARTPHRLAPPSSMPLPILVDCPGACGGMPGCRAAAGRRAQDIEKLYRAGQTDQALQRADAAIAAKPRDAQMRFLKGVMLTD